MKRALPVVLLLLATGILAARLGFHYALERVAPAARFPAELAVEKGEAMGTIARSLERQGLVPDARVLSLWARREGLDRDVIPGTYLFEEPLSPLEILDRLREGAIRLTKVTIPEGLRVSEILPRLVEAGFGSVEDYERLLGDPEVLASLGLPRSGAEGYLYPDTYLFAPGTGPEKVIAALTGRFHEVFDEGMRKRAEAAGLSVHDAVTLASVVEKEAGREEERARIASVMHNRLRIGMPLQSDPTVIYGIEEFDGNLTREHLKTPGPYNTYTNPGLPPGPIASPGREALEAVLEPEDTDFLYFVSRNDGTHVFSRSLSEHNRAVNRFQRARAAR